MKKINLLFLIVTHMILCVFMCNIMPKNNVLAFNNTAEIVMDINTGRILHEKNSKDKKFMASTTKILTAIIIIENCKLDDIVNVSADTVGIEGSSIYLQKGEKISVKDLLYGLMLRSGNDCAETLAKHCRGSNEEFANLMNNYSIKIGAKNSNFTNPHGLHDKNHYTTAYDLALISAYALKNNVFREICSTKSVYISNSINNSKRLLVNKNKMLKNYQGCFGVKTGYTKKAGRCLVTAVNRNNLNLVSVVLNCGPMWERSKTILDNSFNTFSSYNIAKKDEILDFVKIENKNEKVGICCKNDINLPLTKVEYKNLEVKFEIKKVNTPINSNESIGLIKIFCKNNLIFSENIYTIIDIK